MVGDGAGFGLIQQRIATLTIKNGGLSVLSMSYTGNYCYLASYAQTQFLQSAILSCSSTLESCHNYQHALQTYTQACGLSASTFNINDAAPQYMNSLAVKYFDVIMDKIPTSYSLSERDFFLWQSNRTSNAMEFLKAIPISGLNQAVGPRHFRVVLQYRFSIPLFHKDVVCCSCSRPMDVFGDHALHCAKYVVLNFVMILRKMSWLKFVIEPVYLQRKKLPWVFCITLTKT